MLKSLNEDDIKFILSLIEECKQGLDPKSEKLRKLLRLKLKFWKEIYNPEDEEI